MTTSSTEWIDSVDSACAGVINGFASLCCSNTPFGIALFGHEVDDHFASCHSVDRCTTSANSATHSLNLSPTLIIIPGWDFYQHRQIIEWHVRSIWRHTLGASHVRNVWSTKRKRHMSPASCRVDYLLEKADDLHNLQQLWPTNEIARTHLRPYTSHAAPVLARES